MRTCLTGSQCMIFDGYLPNKYKDSIPSAINRVENVSNDKFVGARRYRTILLKCSVECRPKRQSGLGT